MQRLADLTNFVQKCRSLESDISELVELTSIIDEDDVEVEKQLLEEITRVEEELSILEFNLLLIPFLFPNFGFFLQLMRKYH